MNNKNVNHRWVPPLAPSQRNAPFKIKNAHKEAEAPMLGITDLDYFMAIYKHLKFPNHCGFFYSSWSKNPLKICILNFDYYIFKETSKFAITARL